MVNEVCMYIPRLQVGAPAHLHQAAVQRLPSVSRQQKVVSPLPANIQGMICKMLQDPSTHSVNDNADFKTTALLAFMCPMLP